MKVIIEVDENVTEECVVIKCQNLDERILKLQNALSAQLSNDTDLLLYKDGKEYYIPTNQLLFFETENKQVFAHTNKDIYETGYKLYELEDILSKDFMRISKSAIINLNHIFSISKNILSGFVKACFVILISDELSPPEVPKNMIESELSKFILLTLRVVCFCATGIISSAKAELFIPQQLKNINMYIKNSTITLCIILIMINSNVLIAKNLNKVNKKTRISSSLLSRLRINL